VAASAVSDARDNHNHGSDDLKPGCPRLRNGPVGPSYPRECQRGWSRHTPDKVFFD